MVLRRKRGHVGADLGQDDLCRRGADAVDARQVDTSELPQRGPPVLIATSFNAALLRWVRVAGHWLALSLGRLKRSKLVEQMLIIRSDHLVERIVETYSRSEVEELLFAPVAGEVASDLLG